MAESVPVNYTATRGRSLILEKGYRGIAAYSRRIRHCLKGLVLCSNITGELQRIVEEYVIA